MYIYALHLQCCPSCGATLLGFHEKHSEIQAGKTGTIGGGNKRAQTGKNPVYGENITSWYCSKCGVHIIPEQVNRQMDVILQFEAILRYHQYYPIQFLQIFRQKNLQETRQVDVRTEKHFL